MKLRCNDIRVRFGAIEALAGVDLDLAEGHRLSIVGPSGCGKSTLLRVIAGLVPSVTGRVVLDGSDITHVPPHERSIGLMFQEHALFPHRDVAGNVGFGLRMQGASTETIDARIDEMLEMVGLSERRHSPIDTLSGGERQRVALARTLAPGPDIVLLDEPLASLDRVLRTDLLDEITAIFTDLAITAIAVSHDIEEAFRFGTDVAVMAPGRIDRIGAAPDVWNEPATTYTAGFLGFAPIVSAAPTATGVATALGPLEVEVREPASHLAIAPGGLDIYPDGEITGAVLRSGFEHGVWRHVIALVDGSEVVVHAPARHVGAVSLRVDPAAVRFVQPTNSAV